MKVSRMALIILAAVIAIIFCSGESNYGTAGYWEIPTEPVDDTSTTLTLL